MKNQNLGPEVEFTENVNDHAMPQSAEDRVEVPSQVINAQQDSLDERAQLLYEGYLAYAPDEDISKLKEAYEYAYRAHIRQRRVTGEPYITHPLAVANILLELEVDQDTLAAALLHDTVEDSAKSLLEIQEIFGDEVELLVDGVTKLDKMTFSSRQELQAENFRKMFLAMAKDIRVVLIKLADRLHNMRTMKHMPTEKQERIAQETLDIYAPLADRLGVYKWKWELEDLCLRYIDPTAFYELVGAINQRRSEREAYLAQVIDELRDEVEKMGIKAEIEGRPKHFYSIYRKMKTKDKLLDQIYDLFACRVIVETVQDCYAVLGMVHDKFRPMPGRFKDYIAVPKPNMYQSLHTTVFGPKGFPFEVQIRTFGMHRTAEYGIAAHWKYKANINEQGEIALPGTQDEGMMPEDPTDKLSWLRQLLEWQKDLRDSDEYMDALKQGLVPDEVFVFTPRGDVVNLPAGAVPIDFAYKVHSAIGNHMYGAKVNGRIVPLSYELQNGDIVEILTSDKIHGPSRDWLKIAKSSSSRSKINNWFKRQMKGENIARGKDLVDRELKKSGFTSLQLMRQSFLRPILKRYSLQSVDDLYSAIGSSQSGITAGKIIPKLRDEYIKSLPASERLELGYRLSDSGQVIYNPVDPVIAEAAELAGKGSTQTSHTQKKRSKKSNDLGIVIEGLDNIAMRLAPCCSPVPGDEIIGFVTRTSGVTVHRRDCSNIRHILQSSAKSANDAEKASRLVEARWDEEETDAVYQVVLKITARDRRHLLSDISNAIAEEKVSIISGDMASLKDVTATLNLVLEVSDQAQYDRLLGRIKAVKDIIEVRRGY